MIVEDPEKGVYVPNLTEYKITSLEDVVFYIKEGNKQRTMATTAMNQFSSRSHAILNLVLEQTL